MAATKHSPQYLAYLQSPEWASKRAQVLRRSGGRCEGCERRRSPLQVHHNHYRDLWEEDLADLKALCIECHGEADRWRTSASAAEQRRDQLERRARHMGIQREMLDPTCPYCRSKSGCCMSPSGFLRVPSGGHTPRWKCGACGQSWWRDRGNDILWVDGREVLVDRGTFQERG